MGHAQALAEPGRGGVAGVELGVDPVQPVVREREVDQRPGPLGDQAVPPVGGVTDPADLRDRRRVAVLEPQHQVTDERAVVLDHEREHVVGHLGRRVGAEPGELLGHRRLVEHAVGQVADDVRVGVVAQHRREVLGPRGPEHEPLGPDRQRGRVVHGANLVSGARVGAERATSVQLLARGPSNGPEGGHEPAIERKRPPRGRVPRAGRDQAGQGQRETSTGTRVTEPAAPRHTTYPSSRRDTESEPGSRTV